MAELPYASHRHGADGKVRLLGPTVNHLGNSEQDRVQFGLGDRLPRPQWRQRPMLGREFSRTFEPRRRLLADSPMAVYLPSLDGAARTCGTV